MKDKIAALLGAGYEVSFTREGDRVTCHTIASDGDGITATGATAAEALQNATPITDSERDCDEVNPDGSGEHCYKSGPHAEHRDSNGDTWVTEDDAPLTVEQRLEYLEDKANDDDEYFAMLRKDLVALAGKVIDRDSVAKIAELFWNEGHKQANERLVHRLDALEVRLEELESARAGV